MAVTKKTATKPAAKTKKETVQPVTAPETSSIQSQQPATPAIGGQAQGLTLQDLVAVAQVIQVTTQRGAYRAEELAEVGALYNKLVSFLETAGAVTRNAPAQQTEEK
jgi:spore germination cell wall hydrolase CwlJ-like protein